MKKVHYGWVICFACMLQLFVATGLPNAAFGVHLPYILAETGFTNAQGSLIISFRNLSCLIAMLMVDRFYNVLDMRKGLVASALMATVSCLIYSRAESLPVYFLGALFGGAANGLGGMIPISVLISKWFERRRAFALSICSAGSGLATVVLPPVIAALIRVSNLKTAFAFEGLFIAISAILICAALRNTPEEKGILPYSDSEEPDKKRIRKAGYSRGDLSRSNLMWLLLVAFCTGVAGNSMTFLTMLYTDCGYSEAFAAMIFSVTGVVVTFGKFVIGGMTDRWGGFRAISVAYGCMILGLVFCSLLILKNPVLIALSVPFMGMGITITTVVLSYLAEDFSTEATYGRVLKYFQMSHTIGLISFGYVVGVLADVSGGYTAPYWMLTLIVAGSFAVVAAIYRKRIRGNC